MAVKGGSVYTELLFLKRNEKHASEKPYRLRYDPGGSIPRTNCETHIQNDILVKDIRGTEAKYNLDRNGFQVLSINSKLTPEEFNDREKVKTVYYDELKALLKRDLGAKRVEILEHGVRCILFIVCGLLLLDQGREYVIFQANDATHS